MFHQLRTSALGLALVASLSLASPAAGESIVPQEATANGQLIFQIDPTPEEPLGVQVYAAAGRATVLGRYTQTGISLFTADGNIVGTFVLTGSDGSTSSGSYTGTFAPIPDTPDFVFELDVIEEAGTGRMAGVTGSTRVVAILDGITGVFHYTSSGVWVLP